MPKKSLNIKEMRNLMVDYIDKRMDDNTQKLFENNLINYPELQQELQDFKNTLEKFKTIKYNDTFSEYTRNLSVKVNDRLQNENKSLSNTYFKYLAPISILTILFIIIFNINNQQTNVSENNEPNQGIIHLSSTEISIIFDDESIEEAIDLTLDKPLKSEPEILIQNENIDNFEEFNSLYEEFLNSYLNEDIKTFQNFSNERVLETTISEMSNEEFQKLLEEFKNVEIIS